MLQSLLLRIRSYQAALEDMARQSTLAERALVEMAAAIEAVEALPKTKETEALIPLGAGVYTKAHLAAKDEIIVASGAGVFVKKSAAETKIFLEERKKRIEDNLNTLRAEAQRVATELDKANVAAEELYAKLQGACAQT